MAAYRAEQGDSPVAAYYDRLAGVYGEGEYFGARRTAVLEVIAGEGARAGVVLDLGCGNGTFLAGFSESGRPGRAVGMDLSTAMLDAARLRTGATAELVRGDAMALPFRSGAFDLVFMSHVLLLIGDVDACLAGVARLLRRGGVLIATVGASGWPEAIRRVIGAEMIQGLEAMFGSMRPSERRDEPTAVAAACRHSGLRPTWREVEFSVSWSALEEWVRLRWLSLADDALRERAEGWLASLRGRVADRTLAVTETLLIARAG